MLSVVCRGVLLVCRRWLLFVVVCRLLLRVCLVLSFIYVCLLFWRLESFVVCCLLYAVACLLLVVWRWLFVGWDLSVVFGSSFVSVVVRLSCGLLFVVACLLCFCFIYVVSYLLVVDFVLFVVCS